MRRGAVKARPISANDFNSPTLHSFGSFVLADMAGNMKGRMSSTISSNGFPVRRFKTKASVNCCALNRRSVSYRLAPS